MSSFVSIESATSSAQLSGRHIRTLFLNNFRGRIDRELLSVVPSYRQQHENNPAADELTNSFIEGFEQGAAWVREDIHDEFENARSVYHNMRLRAKIAELDCKEWKEAAQEATKREWETNAPLRKEIRHLQNSLKHAERIQDDLRKQLNELKENPKKRKRSETPEREKESEVNKRRKLLESWTDQVRQQELLPPSPPLIPPSEPGSSFENPLVID